MRRRFGRRRLRRGNAAKKARFSRAQIGERPGLSNCKRTLQKNTSLESKSTRTIYAKNLCEIPSTGTNAIDGRQRDICQIRGFQLRFQFRNQVDVPIYASVAILRNKENDQGGPDLEKFFRGSGDFRSKDADTSLNALEWRSLGINTDRYNILWHKRFRLNSAQSVAVDSPYNSQVGRNYIDMKKYIPVGKQFRFEDESTTPVQGNLFLVYYFDKWDAAAATPVVLGAVTVSERHVTYWRETRGG